MVENTVEKLRELINGNWSEEDVPVRLSYTEEAEGAAQDGCK